MILPAVKNHANVKSLKFYQEFQIEEFFTHWPLNTFSKLRCLSLVYLGALMSDCSIELIEQLSTLTNFEYLRIQVESIVFYDQCLKRLLQLIFVENDVFQSLKHFVFQSSSHRGILSLPVTTKQTMLEFLTLPFLRGSQFVQLLPCIPHIKSIKTNYLSNDFVNATTVPISSLNLSLPNYFALNLQLDQQWTFKDIEFLLQQVPNVTQLKLTCHYALMDGNKWEMLLTENCSRLRIFKLIFF